MSINQIMAMLRTEQRNIDQMQGIISVSRSDAESLAVELRNIDHPELQNYVDKVMYSVDQLDSFQNYLEEAKYLLTYLERM